MSDDTMPPELDPELDELVSAVVDGEATDDEIARVDADPVLSARLDELRTVAAAVAAPVTPSPPETREAAVAAALAAALDAPCATTPAASLSGEGGTSAVDLAVARDRRRRRTRALLSAAAVVALVALAVPVLSELTTGTSSKFESVGLAIADAESSNDSDAAASAPESTTRADEGAGGSGAGGSGDAAAATGAAVASAALGELGAFESVTSLADAVNGAFRAAPSDGNDSPATTLVPTTTVPTSAPLASEATGADDRSAACDARGAEAEHPGVVTAVGSATLDGTPVTVLVVTPFNPTIGPILLVVDPACTTVIDQVALSG